MKDIKTVLSIAGSDSSGGAGIQADIKTIMANGCYAMTAITAVTAQNTTGVLGIAEVSPDLLRLQLEACCDDILPDAVKVGMVSSAELIDVIAETIVKYRLKNVVVDPVMVSTSGTRLLREDAMDELTERLFPLANVITPNIPEAEILTGIKIDNLANMAEAGRKLMDIYGSLISGKKTIEEICRRASGKRMTEETISHILERYQEAHQLNILIKGGHSVSDANDLLITGLDMVWVNGERIPTENTHGTGCTLSSAIAANLAKGYDVMESVEKAKQYITEIMRHEINLGQGSGPLNHGAKWFN
jgi:hydroxymethylpyrimidine/phosphomethylpyrimidine kinase